MFLQFMKCPVVKMFLEIYTQIKRFKKKVVLWIWGLFFLAMALPVSSSDLSGRTCSFLSHPFRAGQHNFNRASGKSVFPNQEQPFAAHMFQVRIKSPHPLPQLPSTH